MAKGHKDKVAIITGAANGIGQAFAKRLAEDGVHIAIVDLVDGKDTVKLVEAAGRQALVVKCDVSSETSVAAMAKEVQSKFGHVDIVINCAGVFPQKNFPEMTFADWRKVLSINLDGTFLVTAAFVPGMRARKWGRVVNMASSTLGSVVTGFAHYVASKGGIVGFTRALATDLAPDSITVNAIAPGLTRSPGTLVREPRPGFKTMDDEFNAVAQMQSSEWKCRTIWSVRSPSSQVTTPHSSLGRPSMWMADECGHSDRSTKPQVFNALAAEPCFHFAVSGEGLYRRLPYLKRSVGL